MRTHRFLVVYCLFCVFVLRVGVGFAVDLTAARNLEDLEIQRARLCETLQHNQKTKEDVTIASWTYPMLDLLHRSDLKCITDGVCPEGTVHDEYFASTFARSCLHRGGGCPCKPLVLPESTKYRAAVHADPYSVARSCRSNPVFKLDFDCIVHESREWISDLPSLLSSDVVLFSGTNTRVWNVPVLPSVRCPAQVWAMYEFRPSTIYPFLRDPAYLDAFDVTMGYSKNWTVFTPDFQLKMKADATWQMSAVMPYEQKLKRVAVFISQCGESGRLEILARMMEELPRRGIAVDSYGKCLNNFNMDQFMDLTAASSPSASPSPSTDPRLMRNKYSQKEFILQHYMFTVAFENSVEPDYVSEKVYNALNVGSVPIYWGAPNIAEFVSSNSVVSADAPDFMAEIVDLAESADKYNRKLAWREEDPEDHVVEMWRRSNRNHLCQLCQYVAEHRKKGEKTEL